MPEQPRPENFDETSAARDAADTEDEVSLLDALIVLAKHKRIVLGVPFAVAVLSPKEVQLGAMRRPASGGQVAGRKRAP